jgi:hypothetical protein
MINLDCSAVSEPLKSHPDRQGASATIENAGHCKNTAIALLNPNVPCPLNSFDAATSMKLIQISRRLRGPLLILLLTACAQTPVAKLEPITQCGDLQFEQAGRLIESDGLSVTLVRSPFTVRYMGIAPSNPWMHASSSSSPVTGLAKIKPKELWLVDTQPLKRKDQ